MPDFNEFLLSNYGCAPWHETDSRPKSAATPLERPRNRPTRPAVVPVKRQQGQPFPLKINCIGEQFEKRRKSRMQTLMPRPASRRTSSISQSQRYSARVKRIKVLSRPKTSLDSLTRVRQQTLYRTGLTYKSLRDKLKSLKLDFDQLKLLQKNHQSIKVTRIIKANS